MKPFWEWDWQTQVSFIAAMVSIAGMLVTLYTLLHTLR